MTPIELITFPGAPNLPIFAALEKGFFAQHGVAPNMSHTPNSAYMAKELVAGKYQVGGTAFDNVVAYQEGQGVAELTRAPDLFAFMGATQIELSLVVAPEIERYDQLKGRTLALDALTTGFAFVLYRMLATAGLGAGDYEFAASVQHRSVGSPLKLASTPARSRLNRSPALRVPTGFAFWKKARMFWRIIRVVALRRAGHGQRLIRTRSRAISQVISKVLRGRWIRPIGQRQRSF